MPEFNPDLAVGALALLAGSRPIIIRALLTKVVHTIPPFYCRLGQGLEQQHHNWSDFSFNSVAIVTLDGDASLGFGVASLPSHHIARLFLWAIPNCTFCKRYSPMPISVSFSFRWGPPPFRHSSLQSYFCPAIITAIVR